MDQLPKDPADGITAGGGELRRNPVSGKLVIVAPGRAARPRDAVGSSAAATEPDLSAERAGSSRAANGSGVVPSCPFCPGNEASTPPEIEASRPQGGAPDTPGWTLRVVPNKYPALAGLHEVILHSPDHAAELEDLAPDDLTATVACYQRRIAAQLAGGAAAATLVVNRGLESGASLEHPHAQLFATPVVTSLLQDELMEFQRHHNRHGTCVLCDEMQGAGERLVFDGQLVAWVPAAARFGYELWLAPAEHAGDVRAADPKALGKALRRALVAVRTATAGAPCNLWLHTAPAEPRGPFHWHAEIAPRISTLAGFELGSDIAIVSVDPSEAAAALRAAASA